MMARLPGRLSNRLMFLADGWGARQEIEWTPHVQESHGPGEPICGVRHVAPVHPDRRSMSGR